MLDYSARSRRSSREEEEDKEEEESSFTLPNPVSSLVSPTSSFWTTVEEEVVCLLHELLHDVESLSDRRKAFPAMKEVISEGLDFGNAAMRRSRSLKKVCEGMERKLGWVVRDRFGERRDGSWVVDEAGEGEVGGLVTLGVFDDGG